MALHGNAWQSANYAGFHPPILPLEFRSVFERVPPAREKVSPPSTEVGVSKTLELGTAVYRAEIGGKVQKSMFFNCVLKLVFRYDRDRGF
jgi:hypothetical protein